MQTIEIDTQRLRLRQWRKADDAPFAALNADPRVMEFFPSPLAHEVSRAAIHRWSSEIADRGWGLWAVERRDTQEFVGFVGLQIPQGPLPFAPCVEIAWRLAVPHWGQGFASEAAMASLQVGFEQVQMPEIVSFTAVGNRRSRAVMSRIGMHNTGVTFQHPRIAASSPLRPHCLYLLRREEWNATQDRGNDSAMSRTA